MEFFPTNNVNKSKVGEIKDCIVSKLQSLTVESNQEFQNSQNK